MYITALRSSSYTSFNICQFQYFLVYVLGLPDKSNKAAEKGTICHKVLECLANLKKISNNSLSFEDENLGILHPVDYLSNNDNISLLVKKSFTYYTHPDRTVNTFSDSDLKDCIKWVNIALNYGGGMFDPRLRNVIEAELYFEIPIKEDWAKYDYTLPNGQQSEGYLVLKGTIDLVTEVDDSTIEVVDWKSGRRIDWSNYKEKTFEKLFQDPQLRIYHYALSQLFPDKNIILTIFYLKDGGPFTFTLDEKHALATEEMIKRGFQNITESTSPQRRRNREKGFCKFCYFGKTMSCDNTKNLCQFYYDKCQKRGMDSVISEYSPTNYTLGDYVQG